MFEKLLKDGKFRTRSENRLEGAKEFKKIFRGEIFGIPFGKRQKTKDEVIQLILYHGLASTSDEAEAFFQDLLDEKFIYRRIKLWCVWYFELVQVSSGSKIMYELRLKSEDDDPMFPIC